MHQPVTQNQIRNTECLSKIFFLQFEKRIDSRASFIFKLRQKTWTDIWFLVFSHQQHATLPLEK